MSYIEIGANRIVSDRVISIALILEDMQGATSGYALRIGYIF